MNSIIDIKDVSKSYRGNGVENDVLKRISLTIKQEEFTAIVGPSGSGKSTLLSLIGTLDHPTYGNIYYNGEKVADKKGNQLADFRFFNIGYVFQQFNLLPTLTALENVISPVYSRKVSWNKKEKALNLLDEVGLRNKENSLPSQLSGGEQQRVAIARALIGDPNWLLADEPTGNLDTKNGKLIVELLKSFNENKNCGIIMVTHDLSITKLADRTIEMRDGEIILDTSERNFIVTK
ncbi:MAG: ABC transporter ATP-binding protein [Bacillota bacterium]